MPRRCGICFSDDRDAIEMSMIAGVKSWNAIAKKYGVSWRALQNHAKNHMAAKPAGTAGSAAIAAAVQPPAPTPSGVKGFLTPGTSLVTARDIEILSSKQSFWTLFLHDVNVITEQLEQAKAENALAVTVSCSAELRQKYTLLAKIIGITAPETLINNQNIQANFDVKAVVEIVMEALGEDHDVREKVSKALTQII